MNAKIVGAALVLVFLAGCQATGENADQRALLQLSVNRQKWSGRAIHDYAFDYDLAAMARTPPVHIVVRGGAVNSVTDRNTGAVYPSAGFPTVDSLFALVARLITTPDANLRLMVRVDYNSSLGYPTVIEGLSDLPDAGYVITISNLLEGP